MNLGENLRGTRHRSRYLGYDCYTYGEITAPQKVRCIRRTSAMPARIGQDVRDMMPVEFCWPTASHEEAHRLIDALYLVNTQPVESIIRQFPDHNSMLDPWVERAKRWRAANQDTTPGVRAHTRTALLSHKNASPYKFPGMVHKSQLLRSVALGDYEIVLSTIYFIDGTPALRADIYPYGRIDKFLRLSRVYVDLDDSSYEVIEHYPGRYRGVGLDPRFLQVFLDSDSSQVNKRRTARDNPRIREAVERERAAEASSEPARAHRTAEAAREMHGPTPEEAEVFAPHLIGGAAR